MHIQKFVVTFNKKMNTWSKMRNVFLGGLCLIPRRSAFTYAVCSIGFYFYIQIYDNDQILSKFLAIACNHHRDVFSTAINKMYSDVFQLIQYVTIITVFFNWYYVNSSTPFREMFSKDLMTKEIVQLMALLAENYASCPDSEMRWN